MLGILFLLRRNGCFHFVNFVWARERKVQATRLQFSKFQTQRRLFWLAGLLPEQAILAESQSYLPCWRNYKVLEWNTLFPYYFIKKFSFI